MLFLGHTHVCLLVYETCLILTCIIGDYCLEHYFIVDERSSQINQRKMMWTRALFDNMTHGIVGFFSWAIVINFNLKVNQIVSLLLCFFLALGVDLDHFIEAKSTDIKDAINLPRRPPFHKSTIIPLVSGTATLFGCLFDSNILKIFSLLFTTAWLSHHIRDATRRGLWFPPIGSTPLIPYKLYLCLIMLIPLGIRTIYSLTIDCKNHFNNNGIV